MTNADAKESASAGRTVQVRTIADGEIDRKIDIFDESALSAKIGRSPVWIDLVKPEPGTIRALQRVYTLHPLAIQGIDERHRQSAVDILDDSAHVVAHFPDREDETIEAGEVQVIIGEDYLISIHDAGALDIDATLERWRMTPESWRSTSSSLLYAILSVSLSRFFPVVDQLEDALDKLEENAIDRAGRSTPKREDLYNLFEVTEHISDVYNIAVPLKDVLYSLTQNSDWLSGENGNAWSRSLYDDAVRLTNRLQVQRDSAERLFGMLDSLVMLLRTDVSKQLTVVATIFLPLSFLGTYFGQNFMFMEDAVAGPGDFLIWGVGAPLASLAVILAVMWKFGAFR